ncbi:bactofilin family protein [Sunxiuqinia sp. A32]|uniref:bactofilin family protein n=1 Tax=Sunxiuqinia sp. A32 TaxID=3461496 RepID=UPI0040463CC5
MAKTYAEAESQAINLIGKGTKIKGDIISDGDIRIDGELTGNLQCAGRTVVGVSGSINGEVRCKNGDVSGFVKGKMQVAELLSLKASSKVQGEVTTGKISIEPGALFSGSCQMGEQAKNEEQKGLKKA